MLFCNIPLIRYTADLRKCWNLGCTMFTDNECCCDIVTNLIIMDIDYRRTEDFV